MSRRNVKHQTLPAWEQFPSHGTSTSTNDVFSPVRNRSRDRLGRSSHLPEEVLKALRIGPYRSTPEPEGVRVVGWQPLNPEDDCGHAVTEYNPFET